jgi:hypothetical protein
MIDELAPTAEIPIYHGNDLEQLAYLHRAAENARQKRDSAVRSTARRIGDAEPVTELEEAAAAAEAAYNAFVAEAAERAVAVRLCALPRKTFRALMLEHPPRMVTDPETQREVEHDDDQGYDVNTETFPEALLLYTEGTDDDADRTILAPVFETQAALQRWLDRRTDGQISRMWTTAYGLNRAEGGDPKDLAYSTARTGSTAT